MDVQRDKKSQRYKDVVQYSQAMNDIDDSDDEDEKKKAHTIKEISFNLSVQKFQCAFFRSSFHIHKVMDHTGAQNEYNTRAV